MADYWKSTPKYWCKHCSTHVKDTPFERKQHESTGRHQGNLKRFLRDIQNSHERDEREKQKAKAEVERLNKQFGVSQPTWQAGTSATPSAGQPSTSQKPHATVADRQRQMAQLAEMGIEIPEDQRRDLGLAGGWKTVSKRMVEPDDPPVSDPISVGVHKRKYEGQEEEEEAGEKVARHGWGSTSKRYPGQASEDLDTLLSTHKIQKVEVIAVKEPKLEAESKSRVKMKTASENQVKTEVDEMRKLPFPMMEKKEEPSERELADIPDVNPVVPIMPVFKKRKAKVGRT